MTRDCAHCKANDAEPRRRLCAACRHYKLRNGHLPPARLLRRRLERADQQRFERQAWCA